MTIRRNNKYKQKIKNIKLLHKQAASINNIKKEQISKGTHSKTMAIGRNKKKRHQRSSTNNYYTSKHQRTNQTKQNYIGTLHSPNEIAKRTSLFRGAHPLNNHDKFLIGQNN